MSIQTGEFSYDEVQQLCVNLKSKFDGKYDYIIGISRGGVIPATMLAHLNGNTSVRVYHVNDGIGKVITSPGRYLIVDEIFDSGKTLQLIHSKALAHVKSLFLPGEVEVDFATLLLNTDEEHEFVKYFAVPFDRTTNETWFKFPWEV